MVVAYDLDRTIGKEGELPWSGKLPADMKHFAELTTGRTVIMGRKTYESLPDTYRPLPNRQNIVLSVSAYALKGAEIARTIKQAYDIAEYEPMVIGGADIYRQMLPTVNRVLATEIMTRTIGGDAFFPLLNEDDWMNKDTQTFKADERNKFDYSFITYERRNPIK